MSKIIYLDHAATTKLNEEALKEMYPFLTQYYGNASSNYGLGMVSDGAIKLARQRVAKSINCNLEEVHFTSGGTEADNWAIKGIAFANKFKGNHIITSSIEHPAIIKSCKFLERNGFEVTYLPVSTDGIISIEDLNSAIKSNTILISIMSANNEIGTLQPIQKIGNIAKTHGIYFHTDAVQAIGNIEIDLNNIDVDLLSISGHKFGGPKGIGALYIKNGTNIDSFINGGSQENGRRAGTENVASIVGLGRAIELATDDILSKNRKTLSIRNEFVRKVLRNIPFSKLNGNGSDRLPGNANISFSPLNSKELILSLDRYGICASNGSACGCKAGRPSPVLLAMGETSSVASGSVRFTFGEENTEEEIDIVIAVLKHEVECLIKKHGI